MYIVLLLFAVAALGFLIYKFTRKSDGAPADLEWDAFTKSYWNEIDMGDYTMRYLDFGEGDPVFCIHGFSSSTYTWNKTAKALYEKGFRVIVMDLPGCGRSSIPRDEVKLCVDYMGTQVVKLADALSIDQFSIVGASMGGGISLYLLINHPDRIKRGVVIDPACYMQKHPAGLWLLNHPILGKVTQVFIGKESIKRTVRSTYFDKCKCEEELLGEFARATAKPGYQQLPPRLLADFVSDGIETRRCKIRQTGSVRNGNFHGGRHFLGGR